MSTFGTPVVTEMQVIPVAGYDSMLMTLSGAHAPWFTRNIVILKDSAGHTGIGEIHGGDYTCDALTSVIPLVVGKPIGTYRAILDSIHRASKKSDEDDGEGIQTLDISKLKFVVKAEWAIECALLDLLGQYLDLPMCELLGNGKQRDKVETLGYLFYVSDKEKAQDLPYIDESQSSDPWFRMRRREMLTPEQIVEQAQCLHEKYGFRIYLPVVVLLVLILVIQVLKLVDDTGMPPLFLIAALVACFTGRKMNPLVAARDACADVLPVMGNLMGIGSFVQIMTLNGVRGMITTYCLVLPLALRYVAMGTVIPAFSGISSLGAATVLGIPFVLAFLDSDVIIVSCALSLLCAVGDVMPPSALAGQFSSRLAKVDKYSKVLKSCLPFVLLCVIYGVVLVIFANPIGKLF